MIKILFLLIILLTGCGEIEREEFLMDTLVSLKLYDDNEEAIDKAIERLREIDKDFNNYDKESTLSKINREAMNETIKTPQYVSGLINRSLKYADDTGGSFNPALGSLIELWDIRNRTTLPKEEEIIDALQFIDYTLIEAKGEEVSIRGEGISLDLGAVVKGYASDEVRKILIEEGVTGGIIDLGGNILAFGKKKDGSPFRLAVRSPFDGGIIFTFLTDEISCVSSGNYERFFIYEGERYHHIIDPMTGWPVKSDYSQVSVIGESSEVCDMLSTALYVKGVDEALPLIEKYGVECAFTMNDKRILVSDKLYDMIEKNSIAEGYRLEKIGK